MQTASIIIKAISFGSRGTELTTSNVWMDEEQKLYVRWVYGTRRAEGDMGARGETNEMARTASIEDLGESFGLHGHGGMEEWRNGGEKVGVGRRRSQ